MSSMSLALLIFGVCYLVIITERIHKTIVALCGAAVMIGLGVVSQEEAFYSHEFGVDYNVVFLAVQWLIFRRTMTVAPHLRTAVLALSSKEAVLDRPFLHRCLGCWGSSMSGFVWIRSFILSRPRLPSLARACSC